MEAAPPESPTPRSVLLQELPALVGKRIGTSRWRPVTQEMINSFAATTGDRQWLHVDPERAASGPFGSTIAHGYLTLSLASALLWDVLDVPDATQVINYGVAKVRFPAPVPAGSRLRATVDVSAVEEVKGGLQMTVTMTYEREGSDRPVCVAGLLFRYYT